MDPMTHSGGTEEHGEELLPGLLNEITLEKITPKLPWTVFQSLALVSPAWLHAIRSHQVHDARVRAHSTETLVVITFTPGDKEDAIALYSMRENFYYELAPLPKYATGIPKICTYISCEGKLYAVGGGSRYPREVNVLDLAGQKQWKSCASMLEPKEVFGCASAADGKIYVYGGRIGSKHVRGSELYDPNENTWTLIKSMTAPGTRPYVSRLREELFMHCGKLVDSEFEILAQRYCEDPYYESNHSLDDYIRIAKEVYNPVRDVWRTMEHFRASLHRVHKIVFMAKGKFHCMTGRSIDVHDMDRNSWTRLHSHSFVGFGRVNSFSVLPLAVLAIDDELLAIVLVLDRNGKAKMTSLVRSRGLGSDRKKIVWQKAQPSLPFPQLPICSWEDLADWTLLSRYSMYTIQL